MHIQSCTLKNGTCGVRLSPVGIAIVAKRRSVMSACAFRRVLTAGIAIYLLAGPVHAQTVGASLQGIVADSTGAKVAEAAEEGDAVLTASFDLEALAQLRNNWFVFRDRRPDLYGNLVSLDGRMPAR